ncbi:MAG: glutaredoxin [Lentisphaerae bacterium]|nr:glutaredoxin [Lentisphaerota bacterium]
MTEKMIKLYQFETCLYCARVRAVMSELELTYININVPRAMSERTELLEVSGQPGVPTMVTEDGQVIVDDDDAIIAYLRERYSKAST